MVPAGMKFVKRLLWMIVLVYLGASGWLYLRQDSLIFLPDIPTRKIVNTPAQIGLEYEEYVLQVSDHERVNAWFVPNRNSSTVILVCHGNAGNISHRLDTLQAFYGIGLNVLLFDYRGFGQSTGTPTEQGTYLDAQAAWDFLITKGYSPEQIVIFGRSLGGGVASELASRQTPGAVILESTFTSVPDRGAELYPWLPVRLLARTYYDNLARVTKIKSPLLVLHSEVDEVIPFHHGWQLYQAANSPKIFYTLQGDHNNSWRTTHGYIQSIARFLRNYLSARWYH